jgi:hypothetical protein
MRIKIMSKRYRMVLVAEIEIEGDPDLEKETLLGREQIIMRSLRAGIETGFAYITNLPEEQVHTLSFDGYFGEVSDLADEAGVS